MPKGFMFVVLAVDCLIEFLGPLTLRLDGLYGVLSFESKTDS